MNKDYVVPANLEFKYSGEDRQQLTEYKYIPSIKQGNMFPCHN